MCHLEPSAPIKINKYDLNAVKQTLDDAVVSVVSEGYSEDVSVSNVKLVVGAICIVLAVTSQFWPEPFPSNLWVLQSCLASYLVLTLFSQFFLYIKEKDAVFVSQTSGARPPLSVTSSMSRGSPIYSVAFAHKQNTSQMVKLDAHVSEWFHDDGVFLREEFVSRMRHLLDDWESAQRKRPAR